jgi:hypothetical protein
VQYGLLKKCLEEHRFTVRPYVPQTDKSKRPRITYKAASGGGENTLMNKIVENLKLHIEEEIEYEEGVKIEYGFIIDLPAPRKLLCIGRVDKETFKNKKGQKEATILAGNDYVQIDGKRDEWKILGELKKGKPKFWCDDEVTKQYFDSLGRVDQLDWVDYVDEKEQAEKEAKKKEKKAVKKHRRKMTESTTVTTPSSEMSFGSRFTEEDEAVKARQRAKQNEKRKRQQQRRKEEAEKEAKPFMLTLTPGSDSEDSKNSSSNSDKWDLLHRFPDAVLEEHSKKGKLRVTTYTRKAALESDDDCDDGHRKIRVKLPKSEHQQPPRKDSVKDIEEHENVRGFDEVVRASTKEEIEPYLHRPGTVIVVSEEDIGRTVEDLQALDVKYVGRGL